ncbi:hypothetical protein PAI11_16440 [Patulibacter medicamentivorans]|jgi:hypothetical protein|uniref:Uncharacterized protein n=1 Tax=Patulibacter medicamentivorans TaxID=1097667 RepID=H0E4B7_9ACTN|nr:hypothetical protein [Patulibacter medicamentivorans]EHN11486.1 hypothetical protein PAI11_16440 [Patulibacter medicamentivorans]
MAAKTIIEWPNREKASSKVARILVILSLLVSSALIAIVSIRGWDLLQAAKTAQILFIAVNLIFVIQLLRWSRGVLPMAAGIATFIGIFALVSVTKWYERDQPGYKDADLSAQLGALTIGVLIAQVIVIVIAIVAFSQNWQTEIEHHVGFDDDEPAPSTGAPATA